MKNSKSAGKKSGKGKDNKSVVMKAIKGAIYGLIVTVVSVLVFAIIVKQSGLSAEAISAVNQVIKVVSIFLSALIASKSVQDSKVLTGSLAGAFYVILGYLTFSLIEGAFGDVVLLLTDLVMGVVIGMLTAMIFSKVLAKPAKATK